MAPPFSPGGTWGNNVPGSRTWPGAQGRQGPAQVRRRAGWTGWLLRHRVVPLDFGGSLDGEAQVARQQDAVDLGMTLRVLVAGLPLETPGDERLHVEAVSGCGALGPAVDQSLHQHRERRAEVDHAVF